MIPIPCCFIPANCTYVEECCFVTESASQMQTFQLQEREEISLQLAILQSCCLKLPNFSSKVLSRLSISNLWHANIAPKPIYDWLHSNAKILGAHAHDQLPLHQKKTCLSNSKWIESYTILAIEVEDSQ
jgi:hypothetical protein